MNMNKIENPDVVKMSENYRNPWVIIDADTGEVIDDAQGWGYRTRGKAIKAFQWKNKDVFQTAKAKRESDCKYCSNMVKDPKEVPKCVLSDIANVYPQVSFVGATLFNKGGSTNTGRIIGYINGTACFYDDDDAVVTDNLMFCPKCGRILRGNEDED